MAIELGGVMEKLLKAVEKYTDLMIEAEKYIWKHPETGYKEYKTSAYMEQNFIKLGYDIVKAKDITGFYTMVDTGREGPTVLVLAELDSVICFSHPACDKETGAVHACGHHCQCSALLGIAGALKEKGVLDELCGKIKLCAVPAEELLEIEYRANLIKDGVIKYLGGKSEFMSRGYFDDVDMAIMVHTGGSVGVGDGHIGCIAKKITYKGKASHAGGAPWEGKNALYAATNGLSMANALRETFRDEDKIRFHPIITQGGQMVNAIPDDVKIESYVRGKTYEAIWDCNKRINRALIGSALAIGGNIEIQDFPGYAPEINDKNLKDLVISSARLALGVECNIGGLSSGSTDMGDLSCVMPTVQPHSAGARGLGHGNDYEIVDVKKATVDSAKLQIGVLYLLLKDGAQNAKKVIAEFKPRFASKKEYFDYVSKIFSNGDRIEYNSNDTATIKL